MVDERSLASGAVVVGDVVVVASDEANAEKRKGLSTGKDRKFEEERRSEIGGEDEFDFVH